MGLDAFSKYWFGSFGAVMVLGKPEEHGDVTGTAEGEKKEKEKGREEWEKLVLGTFYVKPNYPGTEDHTMAIVMRIKVGGWGRFQVRCRRIRSSKKKIL